MMFEEEDCYDYMPCCKFDAAAGCFTDETCSTDGAGGDGYGSDGYGSDGYGSDTYASFGPP